ncbi:hypothetical protein [Thermoplasma volcanium]|uniref:hypothetical protein n=1 Tax=Thermoplasma volcanium TaxID=50339 RepID=UPI00064FB0FB|nr:hypothetical protein [Thermoplasma volcanium]
MKSQSDIEYYCQTHNKYFKEERRLQVHSAKTHNPENTVVKMEMKMAILMLSPYYLKSKSVASLT